MKTDKKKIGFNLLESRKFERDCINKKSILDQAINYYINLTGNSPENLKEFEGGFYTYAVDYVKNKHPEALKLGLTDSQYIKLYDYDFTVLKTIETSYKQAPGVLKLENDLFVNNTPDFNIYAETETELQRLKDCNNLIKHITEFHSKYMKDRFNLKDAKFIGGDFININYDTFELTPNIDFIKKP